MDTMKFSIIVPVFNTEEYLEDCIQSVIQQSYSNWELILVDDGSEDNSWEICQKYQRSDSRIQIYQKANSGQSDTRKYGVERANGDVCLFLDADDELCENALSAISESFSKYSVDCVVFGLCRFNQSAIYEIWKEDSVLVLSDKSAFLAKILSNQHYNSLARKAIKMKYLDEFAENRDPSIRYGEDLLESFHCLKKVNSIAFVTDVLYRYRDNRKSVTNNVKANKYIEDMLKVYTDILRGVDNSIEWEKEEYEAINTAIVKNYINSMILSMKYENYSDAILLLNKLHNSWLYNSFIDKHRYQHRSLGMKTLVFFLFKMRFFRTLFLLEKIREKIRRHIWG